jgi:hypothetical protein
MAAGVLGRLSLQIRGAAELKMNPAHAASAGKKSNAETESIDPDASRPPERVGFVFRSPAGEPVSITQS